MENFFKGGQMNKKKVELTDTHDKKMKDSQPKYIPWVEK